MKGLGKRIFGLCAATFGLNRRMQGPQALILMLHRVLPENDFDKLRFQRNLALSEEGLDQLLTQLQRQYTLIHVDEYLALSASHFARRDRFVCLTFDDGWQDNFLYAYPILKAHNVPASIYLKTGYIGTDKHFWWQTVGDAFAEAQRHPDKDTLLQAIINQYVPDVDTSTGADALIAFAKSMVPDQRDALTAALDALCETHNSQCLNWDQVKALSDSGLVRFGAHSVNHVLLSTLSEEDARTEINTSRNTLLERPSLQFNQLFCYPNGDHNEPIMRLVEEAGYAGALSTLPSYASRHPRERYRLPRINITESLARDPSLFNYRLLKAGTRRGRLFQ